MVICMSTHLSSQVVLVVKSLPDNAGDPGLILGSGRSPGEANSYPLEYSCLENRMDRGDWQFTVHPANMSWGISLLMDT